MTTITEELVKPVEKKEECTEEKLVMTAEMEQRIKRLIRESVAQLSTQ